MLSCIGLPVQQHTVAGALGLFHWFPCFPIRIGPFNHVPMTKQCVGRNDGNQHTIRQIFHFVFVVPFIMQNPISINQCIFWVYPLKKNLQRSWVVVVDMPEIVNLCCQLVTVPPNNGISSNCLRSMNYAQQGQKRRDRRNADRYHHNSMFHDVYICGTGTGLRASVLTIDATCVLALGMWQVRDMAATAHLQAVRNPALPGLWSSPRAGGAPLHPVR